MAQCYPRGILFGSGAGYEFFFEKILIVVAKNRSKYLNFDLSVDIAMKKSSYFAKK